MDRIKFIHQPRGNPHHARAIFASCAFHALMLGVLLGVTIYYQLHPPSLPSGSPPGAPTITLQAMVVAPAPPEPPAPTPLPPAIAAWPPVSVVEPLPEPLAPIKLPIDGVPILPIKQSNPILAQTHEPYHALAQTQAKPATASTPSSYSPGVNALPHPPYPTEAQSRGEHGTVTVLVHFDGQGNVSHVEVSESSGVPVLDAETKSFVREHWHCSDYAGQAISQPVEYSLVNR